MPSRLASIALLTALCCIHSTTHAQADVRVYALDCGHAEFDDAAAFSDTGELAGKHAKLANPCFLIQHPRGWLLWDAGFAPDIASTPGVRVVSGPSLTAQLAQLGITPADVSFIAFSHLHFDHVGNAQLFSRATWILDRRELAWAEQEPAHVSMQKQLFSAYKNAHTTLIEGDHDVFGDGRVQILQAPGHTPGSAVLWIALRAAPLILSGDLYLSRECRHKGYVPTVNAERAATLASMARIERLVKRAGARLVIQHDPQDYTELPKPPEYLH